MDWSSLPPLAALRAFSAYAETGSVNRAGDALNVSHAAISQQLRALETHLGLRLLERNGRSMTLTPDGHQLARTLAESFEQISQTITALTGADDARPLHIATSPSFAANWLMPRMGNFTAEHPEFDVMISPSPDLVTLEPGGVDVAVRYGEGGWKGVDSEPLIRSPITVVAAPSLVGDGPIPGLEDLAKLPWIQELGTTEATQWLASHGIQNARIKGIVVPGNLMLDGLRNGQGVAVTTYVAIKDDLESGRLRLLHEERPNAGYHIVTRPTAHRPALKAFLKWLRQEGKMASE